MKLLLKVKIDNIKLFRDITDCKNLATENTRLIVKETMLRVND